MDIYARLKKIQFHFVLRLDYTNFAQNLVCYDRKQNQSK